MMQIEGIVRAVPQPHLEIKTETMPEGALIVSWEPCYSNKRRKEKAVSGHWNSLRKLFPCSRSPPAAPLKSGWLRKPANA